MALERKVFAIVGVLGIAAAGVIVAASFDPRGYRNRGSAIPPPQETVGAEEPPAIEGPHWVVERNESPIDDSPTIILAAQSIEDGGYRYPGGRVFAILYIRCQENKTDLYINAGEFVDSRDVRVTTRVDEERAETSTWRTSTDFTAMFAQGAIAIARRLANAQKLVVRFTPYGQDQRTYTFNVSGLGEYLPEVAKACGWDP